MTTKQVQEFRTIEEIKDSRKHAMAMGPFGSNITRDNFVEKGIPVIRGVNLKNNRFSENDFVFVTEEKADQLIASNAYPEDIVFTHRGTLGQVVIIPKNSKFKRYVVSQSQMKLSCDKSKVNPTFVYYYFCSPQGQHEIYEYTNSTGVPSISSPLSSLKIMKIPYLKLEEQNKIVKTLDDLDAKIQNLQNQNHTLEQMAQAIFQSWFVDFDGVTEFEDSELGKIPKGWTIETIGDFGEIITGKTPPTKNLEYYGNKYSFITIPDMHDKTWIVKTERYLSEKSKNDFSKYFLPENSVLVSCIATVGLISLNSHTALTNQQINSIVCSKNIPYTFVYCTMTRLKDQLITWASGGSATPNLNKGHFSSISVLVPNSKVLENFHNITKNLFKKIQKNSDNIIRLTKTRDTLLPKLMSGEIRV